MLEQYNGSLIKALLTHYPNSGLDVAKFSALPSMYSFLQMLNVYNFYAENYWQNGENRKRFFEIFAHEHGFDPLNPECWYEITRDHIKKTKVLQLTPLPLPPSLSPRTPFEVFCNYFIVIHNLCMFRGGTECCSSMRGV
jgi:hypothetical protein